MGYSMTRSFSYLDHRCSMTITIDVDDFPKLMAVQDVQDLVDDGTVICTESGTQIFIGVKKGVGNHILYELIDILITMNIDYQLKI